MKRYSVQAKRKGSKESWSEWTRADNYYRAEHHACHAEELGYSARIVVNSQIKELWEILGGKSYEVTEKADAIFDARFRKQDVVVHNVTAEMNKIIDTLILSIETDLEKAKDKRDIESVLRFSTSKACYQNVKSILEAVEKKYARDADEMQ